MLPSFLAESSSTEIKSIPIVPDTVEIFPFVDISVVRWKPLVFDPSATVFLITCSMGNGLAFIIEEIVSTMSTAF